MAANSVSLFDLPRKINKQDTMRIARRFAPLVMLHRHEAHLPDGPDDFKKSARFRESNYRGCVDRGYQRLRGWQETDEEGANFLDIPWPDILRESSTHFASTDLNPASGRNVRPLDEKNIYGKTDRRGLFLQRAGGLDRETSGRQLEGNCVNAPVFFDVDYDRDRRLVKILYWFFYSLNYWGFVITHEGDWEHISLFFTEDDFCNGMPPSLIYFAQHEGGIPVHFSKIEKTTCRREGIHPVIYVDRNGHPCNPSARNRERYSVRWETWQHDLIPLIDREWCVFPGAWGAVGLAAFATGPLGPLFKRRCDHVKTVYKNGRLYAKVPKSWRLPWKRR